MSAVIIYGRRFGRRTGYEPKDEPYDVKRAWFDLLQIESYPTEVNLTLARIICAKAELEVEISAVKGQGNGYRKSKIKDFKVLIMAFGESGVEEWRQSPSYYASLVLEIEYRVACAQRFRVEEVPIYRKRKA